MQSSIQAMSKELLDDPIKKVNVVADLTASLLDAREVCRIVLDK
jgi:hypothetical protein